MELRKIFDEVFSIGQGLCAGTISFYADYKLGHPAEVLDFIFLEKYEKLLNGNIKKEEIESLLKDLTCFAEDFEIEEMDELNTALEEFINDMP